MEKQITETSTKYLGYTFVYFDDSFGIAFKITNSANFYRFSLPDLNMADTFINPNSFFASSNIAALTLIQRREDPITEASSTTA